MKSLDAISFGSCYVDTNVHNFPFSDDGIPAETELMGKEYEVVPGGSAVTFCLNLQKLGLKTGFIGMTGADAHGDTLAALLQSHGVAAKLIRKPELQTNISFNMTNPNGENIQLVAGTANAALQPAAVLPQLKEVISEAKMLYIGGCFKLTSFASSFGAIVDVAEQSTVDIVVDHNRIPKNSSTGMCDAVKRLVLGASYYFPSRQEFCELWEVDSIKEGLRLLNSKAPSLKIIVKDGANGAYFWQDSTMQHVPAQKLESVVQVTGAGDSFNAGAMAAISKGGSLLDAATSGNKVAAAQISRLP